MEDISSLLKLFIPHDSIQIKVLSSNNPRAQEEMAATEIITLTVAMATDYHLVLNLMVAKHLYRSHRGDTLSNSNSKASNNAMNETGTRMSKVYEGERRTPTCNIIISKVAVT